jgi:hypothetical protein
MSQLTKKSGIVEIFSNATLTQGKNFGEVQKADYADAVEHVK